MTETVRFTVVLKVGGKPKQYLSFTDPRRDKTFAKAEREQRIMSLKQTPTGNQKDRGIIGVLREKFVSYLVFPKSLSRFAGKRVVGIKYDQLAEADAITSPPPKGTSKKIQAKLQRERKAQSPKASPPPKRFVVQLRLTAVKEVGQPIESKTRKQAEAKAIETARENADWSGTDVSVRVTQVREVAD